MRQNCFHAAPSIACLVALTVGPALRAAGAEAPGQYDSYKAKVSAPFRGGYEQVVGAHRGDASLEALASRLEAIDEVARLVSQQLESMRAAVIKSVAGDVGPAATPGAPRGAAPAGPAPEGTTSAAEIVREFGPQFARPLPPPQVSDAERKSLVGYYNAVLLAARSFAEERGEGVARLSPAARDEATRLALVIPLLSLPDEKWADADVKALPAWVRTPDSLEKGEVFALSVGRPLTAYHLARARPVSADSPPVPPVQEYLRFAAGRLLSRREYPPAIHCLKVASSLAESAKDFETVATCRIQLAELYESAGRLELAAEEVKANLGMKSLPPARFGQCAMLRLKYLYAAGQFQAVADEATTYAGEAAAKDYLPQVLYIQWVALRRMSDADRAKRVQEEFLRLFPKHPLGAEFHFAAAMTALAESKYDEATRLLDVIEANYPDSKLLPKVKEIRKKLQATPSGAG